MKTFEKNFTDFLLEHSDKLDKFAEIKFNTHGPFETFSLYIFNHAFKRFISRIGKREFDSFVER